MGMWLECKLYECYYTLLINTSDTAVRCDICKNKVIGLFATSVRSCEYAQNRNYRNIFLWDLHLTFTFYHLQLFATISIVKFIIWFWFSVIVI